MLLSSGLTVAVKPGSAFINGYYCYDDSENTFTLAASSSAKKTYYIGLRLDLSDGSISMVAVDQGIYPLRNDTVYDLALAKIEVPMNSASLKASNITDLRSDSDLCGFAMCIPETIGSVEYANTAGTLENIDSTVTSGSTDPVSSGAVYTELAKKQNKMATGKYVGTSGEGYISLPFSPSVVIYKCNKASVGCDYIILPSNVVKDDSGNTIATISGNYLIVNGNITNKLNTDYIYIAIP